MLLRGIGLDEAIERGIGFVVAAALVLGVGQLQLRLLGVGPERETRNQALVIPRRLVHATLDQRRFRGNVQLIHGQSFRDFFFFGTTVTTCDQQQGHQYQ